MYLEYLEPTSKSKTRNNLHKIVIHTWYTIYHVVLRSSEVKTRCDLHVKKHGKQAETVTEINLPSKVI